MRRQASAALLTVLLAWGPAHANEAAREDQPANESVKDAEGPIRRGLEEVAAQETIFPGLRKALEDTPPFVRDMELVVQLRTVSLAFDGPEPDYLDIGGREDLVVDPHAWALGGSLEYQSGRLWDALSVGATLFTSQPIDADDPFGETDVLQARNRGYTVLGELWGEAAFNEHRLKAGWQRLDAPFVNGADSRMTPNTFEAIGFRGKVTETRWLEGGHYVLGWIDKIRRRTDTTWQSMSEAAGAEGTSMGMLATGLTWTADDKLAIGAVNYYIKDTLNILYAEADGLLELGDEAAIRLQLQGSLQDSVGADLLGGGERFPNRFEAALRDGAADGFVNRVPPATQVQNAAESAAQGVLTRSGEPVGTWMLGGRLSGSLWGGTLQISASKVGGHADMLNPFGTYPGYVGLMQTNFRRAGELSVVVGFSFVASELGIPELSGFINYGFGKTARDPAENRPLGDQQALEGTLDYKVTSGFLRGFWFRLRGAWLHTDGVRRATGETNRELRFIVNYDIPVL